MSSFDFAALKAETRRVVQGTLGVDATYQDATMSEPAAIRARWQSLKIKEYGDLMDSGYAEIMQGVDRIILIPEDYPGITFRTGGVVVFPDYGASFTLDVLEPSTGPLSITWRVVRA